MPSSYGGHLIANTPQQKSLNDCFSFSKTCGFGGAADPTDPTSTNFYEKCKFSSNRIYNSGDLQPSASGVFPDYNDLQVWNKSSTLGRSPLSDNCCPNYPFPLTSWSYDFSPSQNAMESFPQQIAMEPPAVKASCHPLWPNPGSDLYEEKVHMDFNTYCSSTLCHSPQEDPFLLTYTSHPHHQYSLPGKSNKWGFDEDMRCMGLDHCNNEMLLNLCPLMTQI